MKKVETAYRLWKELCGEDSPGAHELLKVLLAQCHASLALREQTATEVAKPETEPTAKERTEYRGLRLPIGWDRREPLEALAELLRKESYPYDHMGMLFLRAGRSPRLL